MTRPSRLKTNKVDLGQPLRFTFNGRRLVGYRGDTLASALLSNGIHFVSRSLKYHRPRGILAAGVAEPNAIVRLIGGPGRTDCNAPVTTTELSAGLNAFSQNCWPTLEWDVGALLGLFSGLLQSGFYYKTFMWPRVGWRWLYEPAIRNIAGLGKAPTEPDADSYETQYLHCDVLVVGGGPSGIAAALAASLDGGRVVICEEDYEFGGSALSTSDETIDGKPARDWLDACLRELEDKENVTLLKRTTAVSFGAGQQLDLIQRIADGVEPTILRQRWHQVRARRVILATGALERPIVFSGNDRPGVMLASAARCYLNRFGVLAGRQVVIICRCDSAYQVAVDFARHADHVTIVDYRKSRSCSAVLDALHNVTILDAAAPLGTTGRRHVNGIRILWKGKVLTIKCDLVLMAGGWTPTLHLFSQSGGKIRWKSDINAFVPSSACQEVLCVGGMCGNADVNDAARDGAKIGGTASQQSIFNTIEEEDTAFARHVIYSDATLAASDAFVDFQNDVCAKDLAASVAEGFSNVEHMKRYTTTGMATDQGRTSNLNAIELASHIMGVPQTQVGITKFRPPYSPTVFGALSGYNVGTLLDPLRKTPFDNWAEKRQAVFENVGLWRRAQYYPINGEDMSGAVRRECQAVRRTVGIFDASTLGKIEVCGPDSVEFMERMYVNAWRNLKPGACKYGLLLTEEGGILDDGVVGRISEDRFHVTTSTGGAAKVINHFEDYLQTEWPELRVWLTPTTECWAVISVQGPLARELIAPLVSGVDLSPEAFPHMAVREALFCELPVRIFRVSFTGELGFEINVPASRASEAWQRLWDAAEKHGAVPYGTEATHVLRAEKGYIIVGLDTDTLVTPDDLGLGWAVSKKKSDFVGKRSLMLEGLRCGPRKQLVGLSPVGHAQVAGHGCQLVRWDGGAISSEGHITSGYWSATLNAPIALALLADGRQRYGELVNVTDHEGRVLTWRVRSPVFYDEKGANLNA